MLSQCLAAIQKGTAYARREVIVVQHVGGEGDDAMEKVMARYNAKGVRYAGPFHFSRMNNLALKAADGDVLVFLNDDIEPLVDSWLTDLVGQVQRPEIGAAGARLLYPSGALQHAGITIGIGDGCGHVGRGTFYRASRTPGSRRRRASISPGSTRKPRIFTCSSMRRETFQP